MSYFQLDNLKSQSEGFSSGPKTPIQSEPIKMFEQLNMPSPPMSPYARSIDGMEARLSDLVVSRANKSTESELRNSCQESNIIIPLAKTAVTSKLITNERESTPIEIQHESIEISVVDQTPRNFPLEDLKKSKLVIDGFGQINKSGFKRSQLAFLGSYHLKELKTGSNSLSTSSNHNNTTASAVYSSRRNIRSTNYTHSDNDSNTEEKPRTRRFVRQNKFDLESDGESNNNQSSTPATPKRKFPTSTTISLAASSSPSPKRSRPSTPIPYAYDFNQIEDFSPPLTTLPNSNKCLKADWKGQSMDLTGDPLYSKLHPAEIVLAGTLRLPCNVYLDSKRRIFYEKVKRMRMDLPFRRTDAQKSCKIDVNKASRLFAAFEKVGWLQDVHFERFM